MPSTRGAADAAWWRAANRFFGGLLAVIPWKS